jgi:N-acetylglucosaminyldiphosphoundecaprenol N-acetyl-beta-D-mannosaminyltransferase
MEKVNIFKGIDVIIRRSYFYEYLKERTHAEKTTMSFAIERNVISTALDDDEYGAIIRKGELNTFDGSVVALVVGKILEVNIEVLTLADVFTKLISTEGSKHYFLGNNIETLDGLRKFIENESYNIRAEYMPLPYYRSYKDFDFDGISEEINRANPDYIWVGLGAPKQEYFINEIAPYLRRGVIFGVGAVFNFYSSNVKINRAPEWMRKNRLEWLHRLQESPKKNLIRNLKFVSLIPKLKKLIEDESTTYRR